MARKASKSKGKRAKKSSAPKRGGNPKPKSALSRSDIKLFRELLERRRGILRGDVGALKAEGLRQNQDGMGELSSMPIHLADLGSDAYEQEMTLGLMETESDELQEIEEALDRIKEGTFGQCESCGKPIPKMRLKAIPYTRNCIPCQKKEEGV